MLTFAPLTSFIHLNLNGMKKKLSKKNRKLVRLFGSVDNTLEKNRDTGGTKIS